MDENKIITPTYKRNSYLKTLFILIVAALFILNIRFILQQNKWSPIDEYAHMDYVEKIGNGTFPKLSDSIEDEIYLHIKNHPNQTVDGKQIHNRIELGYGNFSYQAKHPPLYYIVLSVPNRIMKLLNVEIFNRLVILRIFTFLIFTMGMFLLLIIRNQLVCLGYVIPEWFAWMGIAFGLMICSNERYGLGNNLMSPLMINLSLVFLLKYIDSLQSKKLHSFVLLSGLSICTALTNIFLIPLFFLAALYYYKKQPNIKTFISALFFLLIPGFLIWLWQIKSIPDPSFEKQMQDILLVVAPCNVLDYKTFLTFLMKDAFTLSFIHAEMNITKTIFYLFLVNLICVLLLIKKLLLYHRWALWGILICMIYLVLLFFLNKYVPRVTWVGFRHYMGFIPFIFTGLFTFVLLINIKQIKNKNER